MPNAGRVGITLLMLPGWLVAQEAGGCSLRDAASPTSSITYMLCENGTIWVTGNGGRTWSTRLTGAKQPLRAIGFFDASHGFVAGESGSLMVTEDGGLHWKAADSGVTDHLRSASLVENRAWIVGYTGIILQTADGGRTWHRQDSGIRQTLDAVYFADAQHGWAVGWIGTILRTDNGGETWQGALPGSFLVLEFRLLQRCPERLGSGVRRDHFDQP
jgi:photosystem II stability/assembly factor-like uncharacterized protein